MVREIITLSIGECGVRFGSKVWQTYATEHNLNLDGTLAKKSHQHISSFYAENGDGSYTQRNILCDSSLYNAPVDPSSHRLHDRNHTVAPKEDCANLYARGAYTTGKEAVQHICDIIRKMADDCDNIQGFIVNHSITGGTSSGLTAQILDRISVDYRRKYKFGFEVCPSVSYNTTDSVCDPYNMILSMHHSLDHTELSLMFDNQTLHKLCRNRLNVHDPSRENLNELIAKTATHFTQDLRFGEEEDNCTGCDMGNIVSELICFPRLHFLTPSVSVIEPKYNPLTLINGYVRSTMENKFVYEDIMRLLYQSYDINKIATDPLSLTRNAFNPANFLMDYHNFDVFEDKYMACKVQYRAYDTLRSARYGYININSIIRQVTRTETQNATFVEWVPTYCKYRRLNKNEIGRNDIQQRHALLGEKDESVVMIGNNTAFGGWCAQRITDKFNKMFDRRAFVHWYYNEGMEEDEFNEARQDLEWLQQDYIDVLQEQATDESEYEDEYNRNEFIISTMSEQQMIDKALKDSLEDWKSNVSDLSS